MGFRVVGFRASKPLVGMYMFENGSCYNILGLYKGNIGIMEKKMESTTVYWAYIGFSQLPSIYAVTLHAGAISSHN